MAELCSPSHGIAVSLAAATLVPALHGADRNYTG